MLIAGKADGPRSDVVRALGFTDILDVAETPLPDLMGGLRADVVIEATGYPPSVTDGLGVLRKGGVLVVAGIHPGPLTLPLTDFVRNRHQLPATHGCDRPAWDPADLGQAADSIGPRRGVFSSDDHPPPAAGSGNRGIRAGTAAGGLEGDAQTLTGSPRGRVSATATPIKLPHPAITIAIPYPCVTSYSRPARIGRVTAAMHHAMYRRLATRP